MKANGNGSPETCAYNLLRIVRGEVPFDRVRGRDGALIDQPNATDEALADAEWVLENYEPRVKLESSDVDASESRTGDFPLRFKIVRKEAEA